MLKWCGVGYIKYTEGEYGGLRSLGVQDQVKLKYLVVVPFNS